MVGMWQRWAGYVAGALALAMVLTACTGLESDKGAGSESPAIVIGASSQPAGRVVELGGGARVIFEDEVGPNAVLTVATKDAPAAPEGQHAFATPIELSLTHGDMGRGATLEFPMAGLSKQEAKQIHIATYNDKSGSWNSVKTTIDAKDGVIRAFTPHFSWWAPWTWDWVGIGARVNQDVGQLVGKRAEEPNCQRGTEQPKWVAELVGVGKDAALPVRSCAESEGDVLVVELVNNRAYGQVLTYGSGVQFGWREGGDSLSDKARNAIVSGVLGKDALYLPPKSRATVGIRKLDAGKFVQFHIGVERATLIADAIDVIAPDLLAKGGSKLVAPLIAECGTALLTESPIDELKTAAEVRDQMFGSVGCVIAAFRKAAASGLLDSKKVEELAATLNALKAANAVGRVLQAYDVEWEVADLFIDQKWIAEIPGIGYGFSVRAKAQTKDPTQPNAPTQTNPPAQQSPSNLSVDLTESPFLCDGSTHRLGTLSGARSGERIEFSSRQVSNLLPGAANGNGQLALKWQCSPSDAGASWVVKATGSSGGSAKFTVTGRAPDAAPKPTAKQRGFFVEDSYYGGTWARHDPNDGTWYPHSSRPGNAAYWFNNGLGVGVDCARSAASYRVRISSRTETWSWWLHVTDNTWIPAAAVRESSADGPQGVAPC
jgi:hypothetical protein